MSAHEATQSRWCAAERCENDAEQHSELCMTCERRKRTGHHVRLHGAPQPSNDPQLYCWACGLWKIDDAYAQNRRRWNRLYRRGRDYICRACMRDRTCAHAANLRSGPGTATTPNRSAS